MASSPSALSASAANTVASPPAATTSLLIHSKSSRHWAVFGRTYTELRVGTAPICCKRRHVLTRRCDGRVGNWWASNNQRGDVITDTAQLRPCTDRRDRRVTDISR